MHDLSCVSLRMWQLVIDPLAGLLSFFSTIYYMPFIENMSKAARLVRTHNIHAAPCLLVPCVCP